MRRTRVPVLFVLCLATLLSACGGGDYSGGTAAGSNSGTGGGGGGNGGGGQFADSQAFFTGRVQPNLPFCRTCHVPKGVADTAEGRRFMLSPNDQHGNPPADDYARLNEAWLALDRGVESNWILVKPSHSDAAVAHSGGYPWPQGSAPYLSMQILLSCWDNPAGCDALLGNVGGGGGTTPDPFPLLGNPGKHYFVNQICDNGITSDNPGYFTDLTPIDWNQDPRRLMMGSLIHSEQYAVHFNDPYELCHVDKLFETQAKQNKQRIDQGKTPIYSAKPDPATCGEWRAMVQEGHDWIAMTPTDSPRSGGHGNGNAVVGAGGLTGSASVEAWNSLWKVWGLSARPDNFDDHVSERYGHTPAPPHIYNVYPIIDPAKGIDERPLLSETFGGTGRLPLGYSQGKDAEGKYSGTVGITCFSCHTGQIGVGEIASRDGNGNPSSYGANDTGSFMGLPNTNTELGVLIADLIHAQQAHDYGFGQPSPVMALGYVPLVNTTRGTNAADTEIEAIFLVRDWDTLNFTRPFVQPLHPSYGDQDPPAWWWLHNKARYLWFGGHSTDSARGNMYFGSVNNLSGDQIKENEGIFESVHQWTLTVEAPDFPGSINTALAEQGAILFHEKNLWADGENADIPQPKGNGACAGCHGAYSPRYANDTRFLPDVKLAGTNSYTVPLEIIDTDPAQTEGWTKSTRHHVSTMWHSYPDAVEGYRLPEEKDQLTELLDDYAITDGASGANLADQLSRQLQGMGVFAPAADVLATVMGTALAPVPGIPTREQMGRVEGVCGFPKGEPGYVAPPLHGVWASAPYFHNGSVPNVWAVLKPEDRPKVWRRQRSTSDVHFNAFEHELTDNAVTGAKGAYDFNNLGWKHDVLACDDGGQGVPYYQCQPAQDLPTELNWLKDTMDGGAIWLTWIVPPPVGDQGLEDRMVFNTNLYSKKNRGHEFTKVLTDAERLALVEYLKTL